MHLLWEIKELEYKTNKEHLVATKYFGLLLNEQNFTGRISHIVQKKYLLFFLANQKQRKSVIRILA